MAVIIEATYSKKLGLPQYSSHQYSVTLRSELTDMSQLASANAALYRDLQEAVDAQIIKTGFAPGAAGVPSAGAQSPESLSHRTAPAESDVWACSDRQRELILRIVDDSQLDKQEVDDLARKRFGAGVRALNKLQASALIDELIERTRPPSDARRGTHRGSYRRADHAR